MQDKRLLGYGSDAWWLPLEMSLKRPRGIGTGMSLSISESVAGKGREAFSAMIDERLAKTSI